MITEKGNLKKGITSHHVPTPKNYNQANYTVLERHSDKKV